MCDGVWGNMSQRSFLELGQFETTPKMGKSTAADITTIMPIANLAQDMSNIRSRTWVVVAEARKEWQCRGSFWRLAEVRGFAEVSGGWRRFVEVRRGSWIFVEVRGGPWMEVRRGSGKLGSGNFVEVSGSSWEVRGEYQ